ncbi:MAG: hypothetical protein AAGE52_06290 [Myxococcota bacterium]
MARFLCVILAACASSSTLDEVDAAADAASDASSDPGSDARDLPQVTVRLVNGSGNVRAMSDVDDERFTSDDVTLEFEEPVVTVVADQGDTVVAQTWVGVEEGDVLTLNLSPSATSDLRRVELTLPDAPEPIEAVDLCAIRIVPDGRSLIEESVRANCDPVDIALYTATTTMVGRAVTSDGVIRWAPVPSWSDAQQTLRVDALGRGARVLAYPLPSSDSQLRVNPIEVTEGRDLGVPMWASYLDLEVDESGVGSSAVRVRAPVSDVIAIDAAAFLTPASGTLTVADGRVDARWDPVDDRANAVTLALAFETDGTTLNWLVVLPPETTTFQHPLPHAGETLLLRNLVTVDAGEASYRDLRQGTDALRFVLADPAIRAWRADSLE